MSRIHVGSTTELDERFAKAFAKFIFDSCCDDNTTLEVALMTAPLRKRLDATRVAHSLIYQSLSFGFNQNEKEKYLDKDKALLALYLRNLEKIRLHLTTKITEESDQKIKDSLLKTANSAFDKLATITNRDPEISIGKISYNVSTNKSQCIVIPSDGAYWYQILSLERDAQITFTNFYKLLTRSNSRYHVRQVTFLWTNGNRYEGEFANGKRNGHGTMTFANGEKYEGNFVNGQRSGKGTMTHPNGDHYEGYLANDQPSGQGIMTLANGDQYKGDFANGCAHGQGIITLTNGDWYEGEFVNGEPSTVAIFHPKSERRTATKSPSTTPRTMKDDELRIENPKITR